MTTCAKCRYSHKHAQPGAIVDIGRDSFQCWRFPPVPVGGPTPQGMACGTFRPIVAGADFCGEFLPKPEDSN